jgi:hypothetical protein
MAVVMTGIEHEINSCSRCKVFKTGKLRTIGRKLIRRDQIIWDVHSKRKTGSAIVHVRVVACKVHEDALIERGGWDGTGDRQ